MTGNLTLAKYAAFHLKTMIERGTVVPDDMADLVEALGGDMAVAGRLDPAGLSLYLITLALTSK